MGAAEFKAACLRVVKQIEAVLSPAPAPASAPILGALRGSVLKYDDPFLSAAAPADWDAAIQRGR